MAAHRYTHTRVPRFLLFANEKCEYNCVGNFVAKLFLLFSLLISNGWFRSTICHHTAHTSIIRRYRYAQTTRPINVCSHAGCERAAVCRWNASQVHLHLVFDLVHTLQRTWDFCVQIYYLKIWVLPRRWRCRESILDKKVRSLNQIANLRLQKKDIRIKVCGGNDKKIGLMCLNWAAPGRKSTQFTA